MWIKDHEDRHACACYDAASRCTAVATVQDSVILSISECSAGTITDKTLCQAVDSLRNISKSNNDSLAGLLTELFRLCLSYFGTWNSVQSGNVTPLYFSDEPYYDIRVYECSKNVDDLLAVPDVAHAGIRCRMTRRMDSQSFIPLILELDSSGTVLNLLRYCLNEAWSLCHDGQHQHIKYLPLVLPLTFCVYVHILKANLNNLNKDVCVNCVW